MALDTALRLAFGAIVVPPMRRALERGERAALRALAIALSVTVGSGLLLVSAVLALSAQIGPVAATGLLGLILLLAAGIAVLSRRRLRSDRAASRLADQPTSGPLLLRGLAIAIGFALATRLLRKRR
jgi:hypothetical protein